MKIVITGACGMIGRKMVDSLLADPMLVDRTGAAAEVKKIVALDVVAPNPPLADDPRVEVVTGEVDSAELITALIDEETDSVFHLAAVVSAGAEQDFGLGMRVNLDGTRLVLDRCRALGHAPRVVFASSCAAFGGDLPNGVTDATTPTPQTTYGITKVIGEYLIDDYTRKGFIDGRALRLPTIVIRPGRPNKAASTWASSILREPLAGRPAVCPVDEATGMWVLSPRRVVEAFRHAHDLGPGDWGARRVVNIPGITVTVAEMMAGLERSGGAEMAGRVSFEHDPFIQEIVAGWPNRFETPRGVAMGFQRDVDLDEIIRVFLEDDLASQAAYYD